MTDEEKVIRALGFLGPSTIDEVADFIEEDQEDVEIDVESCVEDGLVQRGGLLDGWRLSLTRAGERLFSDLRPERYKVFIVHGHDHVAVRMVESFLRNEFEEQLEVTVLMDKPDRGTESLYEKFRRHADDVDIAILLATGDDVASPVAHPERTVSQPRPNVIWEAGRFSERLGDERVFLLSAPKVTMPSNINGAMWISLDDDWRFLFSRNLRNLLEEM